jgi:hypothetical protein
MVAVNPQPPARRVRPYAPEDRAHFFAVVGDVWGREVASRLDGLWDWRLRNPAATTDVPPAMVLEEGGRIVAVIALTPVFLHTPHGVVRAFWGGEFAVDRRHRGTGLVLLRDTTKAVTGAFLSAPNERAKGVFERFGFRDVTMLESRVQIVRLENVLAGTAARPAARAAGALWSAGRRAARWIARRRASAVRVSSLTRFDERFDDLWRRVGPAHGTLTVRDAAFLNWRYAERPDCAYRIGAVEHGGRLEGYVVCSVRRRQELVFGHVVDYLVNRADAAARDALFADAAAELAREGVDVTTCYVPGDDAFYREGLRRCGLRFARPRQPVLCLGDRPVDAGAAQVPRQWFFTRGDSDFDLT